MFLPSLPRNVEAAFRDLSSAKPDTRRGALADVVRHALGDEQLRARAVPQIEKLLRDDQTAEVRSAAAVALADLGAKEALPSLLLSVEDPHPMVRQMAINALGELKDPRGEQRLLRALRDSRPEVRYQALIAYARVAQEEADVFRELLRATKDDDQAIVHIALRLAEERAPAPGKEHADLPAELLDRAAALLTAEHPDVAAAAAILLGNMGDHRAKELLVQIATGGRVSGRMPAKEEEQAAVELVGLLGYESAREALTRRAFGLGRYVKDTCAFSAKVALAAMGDARAQSEIIAAVEGKDAALRESAIVACGRARIVDAKDVLHDIATRGLDPRIAALASEALSKLGVASVTDAPSDTKADGDT